MLTQQILLAPDLVWLRARAHPDNKLPGEGLHFSAFFITLGMQMFLSTYYVVYLSMFGEL